MFYDHYYYSKTNECTANKPDDSDCICWHKEGTDPYKHVKAMQDLSISYSFESIQKIKLTWKKKINKLRVIKVTTLVSLVLLNVFLLFS